MGDRIVTDNLDKCLQLADVADEITMRHFRSVTLHVTTKPDHTPVTAGDMETDQALRHIITQEYGDSCLSEESEQAHHDGRLWILDPIDGTKNFMRRNPVWGTLISVQDDSGTLAAAVSAPALGRRWWARRGQGAWTKDVDGTARQIHASDVAKLSDAYLTYCSLLPWENTAFGIEGVVQLMRDTWRERSFGDFLGHVFVAEGVVDACIEPNTKEWDMAAHAFIVQEAGGMAYTDAAPDWPAKRERLIITSNTPLHEQLKRAIKQ